MKAKIIALIMILSALFAVASFAQEIDPGTGIKICSTVGSGSPAWSPDGKYIVGTGAGGLFLTPSEGGTTEKIYTNVPYNSESRDYGAGSPTFSPDGKEVYFDTVFVDKSRGTIIGDGVEFNLIPVIMAVNIETRFTRVVREEARAPHFSYDGRYYGYLNYDHRAVTDPANAEHHLAIAVVDNVTQQTSYIGEGIGSEVVDFSFSGDNTYIAALIYGTDKKYRLYKLSLDGSTAEEIAAEYRVSNPECSPDGRWIMFEQHSDYDGFCYLAVYNTETKVTKPLFPVGAVFNRQGIWSPDGKTICCNLALMSGNLIYDELYSFDFIEGNIGISPVLSKVPQFVPKDFGTQLANIDLNTVDKADSSLYSGLSYLSNRQQYPVWSPDGKWIAISYTNPIYGSSIWIVSSGGGTPLKVATLKNFIVDYNGAKIPFGSTPMLLGFTPDSQEIVYQISVFDKERGSTVTITENLGTVTVYGSGAISTVRAVNIYTGADRLVNDSAMVGAYSHNGRYFAYVNSYPFGDFKLMLYDTETQQTRKLADSAGTAYPPYFGDDDSYVFAFAKVNGSLSWKKISLDGTVLEDRGMSNKYGKFSPDFRFLLSTLSGRVTLYDTVTGKTEDITPQNAELKAVEIGYDFSPDGKKFCYQLESSKTGYPWQRVYVRDINLSEFTADSGTGIAAETPLAFAMKGNFPNPFNPSTTIQFSLAKAGKVNLVIYNVAGQKIRELVRNAEMSPGIHNVLWDGHDDLGKPVSSGIYLSRFQAGGKSFAGRMLLMK